MAKASGRVSDPLAGFQFAVEIGGKITGYFSEVSGIGSEHDVIEHKCVNDKGQEITQIIPGRLKWTEITLKRGITDTLDIWDWRQKVIAGTMQEARANCSIIMFDRNYTPAARWNFINAWPKKVTGPNVKSDSNEIGVEELVLVHEGMERVKV
jgi:phage tail-like protein